MFPTKIVKTLRLKQIFKKRNEEVLVLISPSQGGGQGVVQEGGSNLLLCFTTFSPLGKESLSPAPGQWLRHPGTSVLWPGAGRAIAVSLRTDLLLF